MLHADERPASANTADSRTIRSFQKVVTPLALATAPELAATTQA